MEELHYFHDSYFKIYDLLIEGNTVTRLKWNHNAGTFEWDENKHPNITGHKPEPTIVFPRTISQVGNEYVQSFYATIDLTLICHFNFIAIISESVEKSYIYNV